MHAIDFFRGGGSETHDLMKRHAQLEAALLEVQTTLATRGHSVGEFSCVCSSGAHITDRFGLSVGLPVETVRIVALAALAALIWTRGRAIVRWASLFSVVVMVYTWTKARKFRRWLQTPRSEPPSTAAVETTRRPPRLTPLPPAKLGRIEQLLASVRELSDNTDILGAARVLNSIDEALKTASEAVATPARRALESESELVSTVRAREVELEEALDMVGSSAGGKQGDGAGGTEGTEEEEDGWMGAITTLGSTTRYRRDADGAFLLKVNGAPPLPSARWPPFARKEPSDPSRAVRPTQLPCRA